MRRTGHHRLRPQRSEANRARQELERLDRLIAIAKGFDDQKSVERLEQQKAQLLVNSLTT